MSDLRAVVRNTWVMPPSLHHLFGRTNEIFEIEKRLSSNILAGKADPFHRSRPPHGLTGLGGIGKTALALAYAHRHQAAYKKVLWVNASGYDISSKIAALAKELGLWADTQAELLRLIREELEFGGAYLLILDNVTHVSSVPPHLPRFGDTRVLLTTRRHDVDFATQQDIDALTSDASLQLLNGEQLRGSELAAARKICELLGGHPLALTAVAEAMAQPDGSLHGICSAIEQRGVYGWLAVARLPPHGAQSSMDRLFRETFPESLHPLARTMAIESVRFKSDTIMADALLAATASRAPSTKWECVRALEDLVDCGLATIIANGRVHFHQITKSIVTAQPPV